MIASILPSSVPALALSPQQRRIYDSGLRFYDWEEPELIPIVAGGSSGPLEGCDNAEKIWNYLIGKGLTQHQVAGIMGNLQVESGFDPGIEEIGNGIGYGIAQWSFGRRTQLENYARRHGEPVDSLQLQLDFMWHELQTTENAAYRHLTRQATIRGATLSFLTEFERAGIPHTDTRIRNAQNIFNQFTTGSGSCNALDHGESSGGAPGPADD